MPVSAPATHISPQVPRAQATMRVGAPEHHIAALDGVRGLAILSVLLYHLLWSNNKNPNPLVTLMIQTKGVGWVGVDLFFALSGFLITGILFDSLRDPHFFRNFYARRVLRIFPLYYAVVLLTALVVHPADHVQRMQLVALFTYFQNTSLYWPHQTAVMSLTGHLWSLAVEEQFYLVWPILLFLLRDRRRVLWATVLGFFAAWMSRIWLLHAGAGLDQTYHLALCRADSLFAGGWLALAMRGGMRDRVLRIAPVAGVFGLAVFLIAVYLGGGSAWQTNRHISLYGYTALAVASLGFIAWNLRPSLSSRLMVHPAMRFFGRYSYGIYIFHLFLPELLLGSCHAWLESHVASHAMMRLAKVMLDLLVSIGAAVLSFRYFEKPLLRFKNRYTYAPLGSA